MPYYKSNIMENLKTPLSIKIIFIFNEVIFWLFNLVAFAAVLAAFLVMINFFGDDLELQVRLPVAFNANLDGVLVAENFSTDVQLVEAYGEIKFPGTPPVISRYFMIPLLIVIGAIIIFGQSSALSHFIYSLG